MNINFPPADESYITFPYTPELLAQIEQDARKHAAEGGKSNPDVCP